MSSQIKVDNIQSNSPPNVATQLPYGGVVSPGYALTCNGGIAISGIVTSTSFSGDGSSLTNLNAASIGQVISIKLICS